MTVSNEFPSQAPLSLDDIIAEESEPDNQQIWADDLDIVAGPVTMESGEFPVGHPEFTTVAVNEEIQASCSDVALDHRPTGFLDFVHVAKRLNRSTRERKKLTTYSLTSGQHMEHISEVLAKRTKKQSASEKRKVERGKQGPNKKTLAKSATVKESKKLKNLI